MEVKEFYKKNYKKLMLVPLILFLVSVTIIGLHYMETGDFVDKDIDFAGGTVATLSWDQHVDPGSMEERMSQEVGAVVSVRKLSDYAGNPTAVSFQVDKDVDAGVLKTAIGKITGEEITDDNYSVRIVGPSMGDAFMNTALKIMLIGFLLTGVVMFFTFKIPEVAAGAFLCGILNIVAAIAFMNVAGLKLSSGTLAALLMFLANSIDDNILIITRVLDKKKHAIDNAFIAFRTGGFMIMTGFVAYVILNFATSVQLFQDFAAVLIAGTIADAINTWFQNTGLVIWYVERKYGKSAL